VTADCLDYAQRLNVRWGVWGGLGEGERRKLRTTGRPPGARGPVPTIDYADIARVATAAVNGGQSAAEVLSLRLRISRRRAASYIAEARRRGHSIPVNRNSPLFAEAARNAWAERQAAS
jgi:hypothetical protein